jgi:drug/metabolite transporter (DMT)-like permease
MWRLLLAMAFLSLSQLILFGTLAPAANHDQWGYLGLSGVIGLGIGDLGYFGCLVILGPRRGTLLMAVNPIFSSIAGLFVLGEVLNGWSVLGIAVALTGVLLVIFEGEDHSGETALSRQRKTLGVSFGILGSLGQGLGLVISKYGMRNAASPSAGPLDPLSAALIRMVAAAAFFAVVMLLMGKYPEMGRALRDRTGMAATFTGTLIGPFLGVWISMVAISYSTFAGVASMLMSLMPVFIIPVVWVLYGQRTSWRGIIGVVVAISGVAMLLLL